MSGAPADLVLRGGHVVVGDAAGTVLPHHDVAVTGTTITAIVPAAGADGGGAPVGPSTQVVDVAGDIVLPGFVNAHLHETLDRGVFEDLPFMSWLVDHAMPKDRAYAPEHQRAAAWMNQAELIRNGTTSFIDIFRHPHVAAEVAEATGLRATFSPQVIDDPAGVGETLAVNERFVRDWTGRCERIRAWFGPHSLYTVAPDTFRSMRRLADELGVGIHTHLAESRDEVAMIARAHGRSPARLLHDLVGLGPDVVCAHGVELDDDGIELLAARRTGVAHCPTSNAKLGNRVAPVARMLAAGVRVGLGTDSIMTNNDLDPFEEMRAAALAAKQRDGDPTVLPARTVLHLATLGSATVLGLDGLCGSLEVGKRADLCVVATRHPKFRPLFAGPPGNLVEQLVWCANGNDVRLTMCDGRVLFRDGAWLTLDVDAVMAEADRWGRDLLVRAGLLGRVERPLPPTG